MGLQPGIDQQGQYHQQRKADVVPDAGFVQRRSRIVSASAWHGPPPAIIVAQVRRRHNLTLDVVPAHWALIESKQHGVGAAIKRHGAGRAITSDRLPRRPSPKLRRCRPVRFRCFLPGREPQTRHRRKTQEQGYGKEIPHTSVDRYCPGLWLVRLVHGAAPRNASYAAGRIAQITGVITGT